MTDVLRVPMRNNWHTSGLIAWLWLFLATPASAADANRYSAMLEDGTRVSAAEIATWADPAAKPTLAGKFIFHATNPVRWIHDTTQHHAVTATSPKPAKDDAAKDLFGFVEFVGGDRLPGRIAGALTGQETAWTKEPATLLVEPTVAVNWPDYGTTPAIRVRTSMLKRVVWERNSNRTYVPGTAFLRDGRALKFRSLRWERTRVNALTEDGLKSLSYDQLAEIHLPATDPWSSLFAQLAVLTPTGAARLMQLETADGLVATTSTERFQPTARGDKKKPDNWYQLIQPAWSLDPLYVRFRQIKAWRFFWPHQVPLSIVRPTSVTHRPTFGASWVWQTNRNVRSTPLFLGPDQMGFGWGFGVSAFHELRFALPSKAIAFRTRFGLDSSVGSGGCVRPLVQITNAKDATVSIFDGSVLVGSKNVGDTGRIALAAGTKALLLIVDPVHQGRPRGADPFDIRDIFDWADPELWLDPKTVKQEIAKRVISSVASLRGWKLTPEDQQELEIVNHWDVTDSRSPRYRQVLLTASSLVRLSRQFSIPKNARWIGFSFASPPDKDVTPAKFQVRVGGEALGAFTSPPQTATQVDPILFPVERFRGKDVAVEVLLTTGGPRSIFNWGGVSVTDHRPGLLRLFEDEGQFVNDLRDGKAEIALSQDEPYKGTSSIKMAEGQRGQARLRGLQASIRERPGFGEYRYIRFYWKKKGGTQLGLSLAHDGQLAREDDEVLAVQEEASLFDRMGRRLTVDLKGLQNGFRYLAGTPPDSFQVPIRVQTTVPSAWTQVQRDLYVDMGNFDLTGLRLECPDGEFAYLDHVYLARHAADFNFIEEQLKPFEPVFSNDPNIVRVETDLTRYSELLAKASPLFSTPQSGGGIALMKEHMGRKNIVRTMPVAPKQPCVLHAAVSLPKGKKAKLVATVSHMPESDWQFIVLANGKKLHDSLVSKATAKDGWRDIELDLSSLAGQDVLLEVHNHPNNWPNEAAYWEKLDVLVSD